jgi:hypothetical protein
MMWKARQEALNATWVDVEEFAFATKPDALDDFLASDESSTVVFRRCAAPWPVG